MHKNFSFKGLPTFTDF